jgi:hypothetical protein
MGLEDVNIEEKLESADTPDQAPKETEAPEQVAKDKTPDAEAVFDLSKAQKVRFEGKDWTPEEIKKHLMRQEDYTRKTQAIAEERKYFDNLTADLESVKRNPALISEFKRIYPEKYHRFVDVLGLTEKKEEPGQKPAVPQEYLERIERIEQTFTQREKEAFNAKLEVIEQGLQKKFSYANLTDVYGAADTFFKENGIQPNQVDEKMLEPFFKASHEYNVSQFKKWQEEQLKTTREVNKSASDIGRGGGTPGQAPKKYRRLEDVADDIIASGEL